MTAPTPSTPRRIDYMRLEDIPDADVNPKDHDEPRIAGSISRFGFADAPILDERTGQLVAGHGRKGDLIARHTAGGQPPEGIMVDEDGAWLVPVQRGWRSRSDEDAKAFLVAHNRLTETGGWDERRLAGLLEELGDADPDLLELTGFNEDDIDDMLAGGDGVGDLATSTGKLIDLIDVTVDEPTATPHRGDVWTLGRHTLVIARVMDEHAAWRHLLDDDTRLCPYPDPYITHGTTARDHTLLMVQPSTYLAGHTIDKFAAAFPDEPITCDGEPYTPGAGQPVDDEELE